MFCLVCWLALFAIVITSLGKRKRSDYFAFRWFITDALLFFCSSSWCHLFCIVDLYEHFPSGHTALKQRLFNVVSTLCACWVLYYFPELHEILNYC